MTDCLKQKLDEMSKLGVIVKEEWVSNILIKKRKNKTSVCLDPLYLSQAHRDYDYQMATME